MSDRYKGAILSPTAPTVTPQSAGGIYTSSQQLQYQGQGVWPSAVNYPINNSLRFRASASAYLNRTPASAGNRRTWTWSGWVKRGALGSTRILLNAGYNTIPWFVLGFGSGNTIDIAATAGSSASWQTAALFRDPSAWYHVVLAVDTTSATSTMNGSSTDRFRLYVNGTQYVISGGTVPTQNSDLQVNNTISHTIGGYSGEYFDGYLAEVNFIDGTALTPSSFGTTDAYGIWQPIPYTGAYGTNGFYLPFTDNSALTTSSNVGLGKDFSGNGNYWVTNNISITAGSTYDSMKDVPTNTNSNTANYCTLNPLDNGGNTVSNGNLVVNTSVGFDLIRSTMFVSSGKWYWEITCDDCGEGFVGISSAAEGLNTRGAETANSATIRTTNGDLRTNAVNSAYGSAVADGNIMMFALDMDSGKFWAGKSGTWFNSGNPAAGTNAGKTGLTVAVSPSISVYDNEDYTANFGQRAFSYTPPSGFYPLNTYNLPTPTILDGDQYFNAVIYNGNGSTQTIATGFQPDFTWIKVRNVADDHFLYDSVRGATKYLSSNTTGAEGTISNGLTAFASTGFTLGDSGSTNNGSNNFASWSWRASNAAGVSNTQGTITSTVSANTTSGFSIATFTIQSSGNATVGHGLGVAPSMIIIKSRSAVFQWNVYHASLGNNSYLVLNTTAAEVPGSTTLWNSTSPTSTVFSLGTAWPTYLASATAVAYCFAQVAGYSAFGSYTGNGSSDGPFVYTGFRPRFVMIKLSSNQINAASWVIWDTSRSPYNLTATYLNPNTSDAESTDTNYTALDILSNGFKIRSTNTYGINQNGAVYIYACFAENPFKIARGR